MHVELHSHLEPVIFSVYFSSDFWEFFLVISEVSDIIGLKMIADPVKLLCLHLNKCSLVQLHNVNILHLAKHLSCSIKGVKWF